MERISDSPRGAFVSLCPVHEWGPPPREKGPVNFWSDLEGHAFDLCEEIQDWETPKGVENVLDHLRKHFEPIEVFGRGRVVDGSVLRFRASAG